MARFARVGLVLAGFLLALPALSVELEVIRSSRIYAGPSSREERIGHVERGARVTQLRRTPENDYVLIGAVDGLEGWIYQRHLRQVAAQATEPDRLGEGGEDEILPDVTGRTPPAEVAVLTGALGLEIYVFELGQADSVLVVGPPPARRTLLIDLGTLAPGSPRLYDEDNHVYVRNRIREITGGAHVDYLLISHFHSDHTGEAPEFCSRTRPGKRTGLFALLGDPDDRFTVGDLLDRGDGGVEFTGVRSCSHLSLLGSIDQWTQDGIVQRRIVPPLGTAAIDLGPLVTVEVLAIDGQVEEQGDSVHAQVERDTPGDVFHDQARASENDFSIALEISVGDFELFTAGDLTGGTTRYSERRFGDGPATVYTNIESPLLERWRQFGRESDVEVYRANHHGSGHSSNQGLAHALDPEVVIYSCGKGYDHPAPSVVQRFSGADQYVTSGVSDRSWGGNRPDFPGQVVGEIAILVAADGSSYTLNGTGYTSRSDAQESSD